MRVIPAVASFAAAAALLAACSSTDPGSAQPASPTSSATTSSTPASSAAASSSATSSAQPTAAGDLTSWVVAFCGAVHPITVGDSAKPQPTKEFADTVRARAAVVSKVSSAVQQLGDPPSGVAPGLATTYATGLRTAAKVFNDFADSTDKLVGSPTADADFQQLLAKTKTDYTAATQPAEDATPKAIDDLTKSLPQCQ